MSVFRSSQSYPSSIWNKPAYLQNGIFVYAFVHACRYKSWVPSWYLNFKQLWSGVFRHAQNTHLSCCCNWRLRSSRLNFSCVWTGMPYVFLNRSLALKETILPLLPSLDQIKEWLKLCGLLDLMKAEQQLFKIVFVENNILQWTFEKFGGFVEAVYSERGTLSTFWIKFFI